MLQWRLLSKVDPRAPFTHRQPPSGAIVMRPDGDAWASRDDRLRLAPRPARHSVTFDLRHFRQSRTPRMASPLLRRKPAAPMPGRRRRRSLAILINRRDENDTYLVGRHFVVATRPAVPGDNARLRVRWERRRRRPAVSSAASPRPTLFPAQTSAFAARFGISLRDDGSRRPNITTDFRRGAIPAFPG